MCKRSRTRILCVFASLRFKIFHIRAHPSFIRGYDLILISMHLVDWLFILTPLLDPLTILE